MPVLGVVQAVTEEAPGTRALINLVEALMWVTSGNTVDVNLAAAALLEHLNALM